MSHGRSAGLLMLTAAMVDRHFRGAGLEHRVRFVASGDETGEDRIDVVEAEGGVPISIRLRGERYGVVRYHHDDDGEVGAVEECGWFDTPALAAACVIGVLRRAAAK